MNKDMLILGFGRVTQMIAMLAAYRLLSSLFTAAQLSSYYFLLSIAGVFGLLIANPVGMYLCRIVHDSQSRGQLGQTLDSFFKIFLGTSLLVAPIVYLFQSKISGDYFDVFIIAIIIIIFVAGTHINGFFLSILNLLSKNTLFVILTALTAIIGIGSSFTFVKMISNATSLWLLGQGGVSLLFGLVAYFLLRKEFNGSREVFRIDQSEFARFSIPIVITNIFVWIMAQSFRFFLKGSVDDTILGEMAFGLGMATALAVAVEYLFQQLLFPKFYSSLSDDNQEREKSWNSLFRKSLPAYICLSAFMVSLSPHIVGVLADESLKNAYVFFAVGSVVELFRMLGNVVNMAFHSEKNTSQSIIPYMTGGLLTLVGVIFISLNSQMASSTPYVLLVGQFIIFTMLYYKLGKIIKISSPLKIVSKYALLSIPFGLSVMFSFEQSLAISIFMCLGFGLYLLFLFHLIQRDNVE